MNRQGFDKISTNTEIIISLYELLQFEDQLRLAQVSDCLGSIFENYILKTAYRSLTIGPNKNYYVVTNGETNANRLALKPSELLEFLRFYADKLNALGQWRGTIINLRPFRNLTSLSYRNMTVSTQHLQSIADNCPKMESIAIDCCSDENREFIVIGDNWSVEAVLKLKNLKRLRLENAIGVSINYRDLRQLITQLPMEYLCLKATVVPSVDASEEARRAKHLRELDISTTFHPEAFPTGFPSYLANFENLVKLSVRIFYLVTDDILAIMASACLNLETLCIQFSNFGNVEKFPIPAKLTELSLYNCRGLTKENLKHILTELKISKFSSLNIEYEGEFEDFPISPYIESLDYANVNMHKFKSAYEGNENLKELTWYDEHYTYDDDTILSEVPLEKCIRLETLNIKEGFMPLNTLLQLKSLQKLVIPQSMSQLNWAYVTAVLKHPPLKELILSNLCSVEDLQYAADVPELGFATNVRLVKISEEVFGMALDFWLDLFRQSDDLKLVVYKFRRNTEFMKTVINHKHFVKTLKKLDICGFSISK